MEMTWKVVAAIRDFRENRSVMLSARDSNEEILGNCLVDFSGTTVELIMYVSGGDREQAMHRAGREFHNVVMGINLIGGESVYAEIKNPEEISDEEANEAITMDCPEEEETGVFDLFFIEEETQKAPRGLSFEDLREWVELYTEADDWNKRRIKEISLGMRLAPFDMAMANFYAYKVIEDVLTEEFQELKEKSDYSRGRMEYFVGELRNAFDETASEEMNDALDTLESNLDDLEDFPRGDQWEELANRSGFYNEIEERKDAIKSFIMTTYYPVGAFTVSAYQGDAEAQAFLKQSDQVDYEKKMNQMEEIEQEAEERAEERIENNIETWKETIRTAQDRRNYPIAHGLRSSYPSSRVERETEFAGMIEFAKHLVKKSIRGDI